MSDPVVYSSMVPAKDGFYVALEQQAAAATDNYLELVGSSAGSPVTLQAFGTDSNITIDIEPKGTGQVNLGTNYFNYIAAQGAASGNTPQIAASGNDLNINLALVPKGSGSAWVGNNFANYFNFVGATTGNTPTISTLGSDSNISLRIQPKGTGVVNIRDRLTVGVVSNSGSAVFYGPFGANTAGTNGALSVQQSVNASGAAKIAVANFSTNITGTSTAGSTSWPFSFTNGTDNSSAFGNFLYVGYVYGGAAWQGGRNGMWVNVSSNADSPTAVNSGKFLVGMAPWWRATHWMGSAPGTEAKEIYGTNPLAWIGKSGTIGARNVKGAQAFEANVGGVFNADYYVGGRFIQWGDVTEAVFTASISGTLMTVSAVASGTLAVGQVIDGFGIADNQRIVAFGTGSGGVGTYTVSKSQSLSSTALEAGQPNEGIGYWADAYISFSRMTKGNQGHRTLIGLGDWSAVWPIRANTGTIMETIRNQSVTVSQPAKAAAIGFYLPDVTFNQAFAWTPGFYLSGVGDVGGNAVSGAKLQTISAIDAKSAAINTVTVVRGGRFARSPTIAGTPTLTVTASPGGGTNAAVAVATMAVDWPSSMASPDGNRGVNYVVGDVLTDNAASGTATTRFQYTVEAVDSAGAIIDMRPTQPGNYSVLPTNPITLTGGSGSGASVTPYWTILTISVSTAGTLYSEHALPYIACSNTTVYEDPILIPVMSTTAQTLKLNSGKVNVLGIPTSAAGLVSGDVYSNAGVLTVVP